MTQEVMWSLLVALAAIAIAAVLDSVRHRRDLYLSDKELSASREQVDSLKKQHEQTISDLKERHVAEMEKFADKIPLVTYGERLEELREKILVLVAQTKRLHDAQIAEIAGVTKQLATLHLHELREVKFVRSSFGLDENSYQVDVWFVEQPGRKYLSNYGLL